MQSDERLYRRGCDITHPLFLSFLLKELLHELAALVFKDAGGNGTTGMEGVRGEVGVASLGVATAIDDTGNLTPTEGSGTHSTGFDGDVEGAVDEVFTS